MKHTLKLTALALGLTVSSSLAYDVTVSNSGALSPTGSQGIPILDNLGNPLAAGRTYVGTFPVGTDLQQPLATLLPTFQQFGSAILQPPNGSLAGLFNNTVTAPIAFGSVGGDAGFYLDQLFVLVTDETSGVPTNANFAAIFSNGTTFGKEDDSGAGSQTEQFLDVEDVVYGDIVTPGPTLGPFPFAVSAQQVNIPEPSASLLAGLAGLSLLIRRRR